MLITLTAIFSYTTAERLDVFNGAALVQPENSALNADGNWVTSAPPSDNLQFYHPALNSRKFWKESKLKLLLIARRLFLETPDHLVS